MRLKTRVRKTKGLFTATISLLLHDQLSLLPFVACLFSVEICVSHFFSWWWWWWSRQRRSVRRKMGYERQMMIVLWWCAEREKISCFLFFPDWCYPLQPAAFLSCCNILVRELSSKLYVHVEFDCLLVFQNHHGFFLQFVGFLQIVFLQQQLNVTCWWICFLFWSMSWMIEKNQSLLKVLMMGI